ncbi:hypothetical protein J6590_073663 [Homalodisca vitripennis]|nr:hypothetical protein J6590_073663 [Homalodisca vitripennis]
MSRLIVRVPQCVDCQDQGNQSRLEEVTTRSRSMKWVNAHLQRTNARDTAIPH